MKKEKEVNYPFEIGMLIQIINGKLVNRYAPGFGYRYEFRTKSRIGKGSYIIIKVFYDDGIIIGESQDTETMKFDIAIKYLVGMLEGLKHV